MANPAATKTKRKRYRKSKAYSKKSRHSVARNYPVKKLPPFEQIASAFKPVDLAAIPELAPYVETVVGEETIRNFQFRAYPTKSASEQINRTIGCCRVLHNKFVEHLYNHLEATGYTGGKILDYKVPLYPEIKKLIGKDYMDAPDATAYTNVREAFEKSIDRFNKEFAPKGNRYTKKAIRRAGNGGAPLTFRDLKGLPKFHTKFRATDAYSSNMTNGNISISVRPDASGEAPNIYTEEFAHGNAKGFKKVRAFLKLPKTEKFEIVIHRPLPANAKIKKANIRRERWGEYVVTLAVVFCRSYQKIKDTPEAVAAVKSYLEEHLGLALGLDYAQREGCVGSGSPEAKENLALLVAAAFGKQFRHMESRLAFLQRLKRRKRGPDHKAGVEASLSYRKLSAKIAKLDGRIRRRRKDALEKLSRVLSGAFLLVAVEDIDLRAMAQSLSLAKNLLDNGFGMFRGMLRYKLAEQGKLYVVVARDFASSQLCHDCGYKNPETKDLNVRDWVCPVCGEHHDRDCNAAANIRDEGIRTLETADSFKGKTLGRATVRKYSKLANRI